MTAEALRERLRDRSACVAVIGAGYVGLPLVVAYADAGFRVVAVDVEPKRIAALRAGTSYIQDISSSSIAGHVDGKRLTATDDYDALRDADLIFVAVPTPFDRAKQPDLSYVTSAANGIAQRLRTGQLIILESTTYPGTTDEVLRPILEANGLRAGRDFFLAFSPERIDPGNTVYRIQNTPKVVGGVDPASTELATYALQQVIPGDQIRAVSSARAAELTKLLENTFRAVNIALVNELAVLCDRMGIDVWEVIDAAATKPYGFMPFYPGPGVGGHCIPVDPYYLSWKAREYDFHTKFIELAAETNLEMPFFTVARIRRLLDRANRSLGGARVLVIGAAFKRDVNDDRGSAAIRVMEILASEGADVRYHDPFVPEIRVRRTPFAAGGDLVSLRSVALDKGELAGADVVALLVAHTSLDLGLILEHAKLVFDAVNATKGRSGLAHVERL